MDIVIQTITNSQISLIICTLGVWLNEITGPKFIKLVVGAHKVPSTMNKQDILGMILFV